MSSIVVFAYNENINNLRHWQPGQGKGDESRLCANFLKAAMLMDTSAKAWYTPKSEIVSMLSDSYFPFHEKL